MILSEQAVLITTALNEVAADLLDSTGDSDYDIQFHITDTYQEYAADFTIDNASYIPGILRRMDPFVPKSPNGVIIDYLEVEFYIPVIHKETVEKILTEYQLTYHAITQTSGTTFYVQYIGKQVYEDREKSSTGDLETYQKSYIRVEWDTILDGVHFDQTSVTIDNVVYPVKLQTYRNDKSTIATKAYNDAGNVNNNLVNEELVITIPLNSTTATSNLWEDIHTRVYNKTYTIIDNYGSGGEMTKTWELKAGIVNKEENKIVSFTCIFDIPLPRAVVTVTHKPLVGSETTGELIIVNFSEGGTNSLDARMINKEVKANELRQGNAYSISFIYEPGSEIGKILAYRCHKKIDGDRFDITYTFEDLSFTYENLVLESGSHAWIDNPGMSFTCNFVEGL